MNVNELAKYRVLDVDDLIVMQLLLEEVPCSHIAKKLGLTPPAVSHRRSKYREHFEGFFEIPDPVDSKSATRQRLGKRYYLSDVGKEICRRAVKTLSVISDESKAA